MNYDEAVAWLRGERSMTNIIPHHPEETWHVRVAEADAAMTQQAYWVVCAQTKLLEAPPLASAPADIQLFFVGESFYFKSGTMMSSIYTTDFLRYDWGLVSCALRDGKTVSIRPATENEMMWADAKLEEWRQRARG